PTAAIAGPVGDTPRSATNKIAPKNRNKPPRKAAKTSITRETLAFTAHPSTEPPRRAGRGSLFQEGLGVRRRPSNRAEIGRNARLGNGRNAALASYRRSVRPTDAGL